MSDRRVSGDDRPFSALLVALDDEPFSIAALEFARLVAERDGARVNVVCVFQPSIPVPPQRPGRPEHRCEPHDRRAAAALRSRVKLLTREHGKREWNVHLRVGHAPWVIADFAASSGAELIIVGHRGKNMDAARELTRHTAHQIAMAGEAVLSVPDQQRSLPRSGLVLHDQSPAGDRVVRLARRLLGGAANLQLVGESPYRGLLARPELGEAELIAVPVPGDSFDVRALMSGGAADLLDHACCAVLLAPAERTKTERDDADELERDAPGKRSTTSRFSHAP